MSVALLALTDVLRPAAVVRVEAEALDCDRSLGDGVEEGAIVRDEQDRSRECFEGRLERFAALEVEVVRRLVDDEEVRAGRHHERQRKPPSFTAGKHDDGLLVLGPPGEEETPEQLLRVGALQARCALDALQHRATCIELHLLLREVRRHDAVAETHEAVVGLAPLQDGLQQRGLARTVRAD